MIQQFDQAKNFQANTKVKSRHRVVVVHPSVGAIWSGGSEVFALEISRHLQKYFEVELLSGANCEPFCHPAGGITRDRAYKLVKHPLLAPFFSRLATNPDMLLEHLSNFLPCAWYLTSKPADLIFPCNDYGGLAMAALVRKLKGTPILFTEHSGAISGGKALARNLIFQPDMLVLYSEAIADMARKLKPQQPIGVVPNGVNLVRFTEIGDSIDFGLPAPIVLCVASLKRNKFKRIELAIEAMARMSHGSLLIAGDGVDRDYYQALGEKLLGAKRFAIASFTHEQMPAVYRGADIFTLPSKDEPFGIAYIEAMACGLPVVAPDDEMRRYIVGDGGILCDVTDSNIYSQAIAKTANQDWSGKVRHNALRFSWDEIAIRYRDLILKTINQSTKK
jgi:glycosyltransferase involved in cell wall biosynthesis